MEARRLVKSSKYRNLALPTVEDLIRREASKHRDQRKALAAARRRLHRVAALYLGAPNFAHAKKAVETAFDRGDQDAIERACEEVLCSHASTRERFSFLPEIFDRLMTITGFPKTLLDVACAVQPLGWRWTGLPRDCHYTAVDINSGFLELAGTYFEREGIAHTVQWVDALVSPCRQPADVALLWKMFHCLENRRSGAALEVIQNLRAHFVAVSFPTRNLSGRRIELHHRYAPLIAELAKREGWRLHQFDVPSEHMIVIEKDAFIG